MSEEEEKLIEAVKARFKSSHSQKKGGIYDLRGAVNTVFDVGEDLGWNDIRKMDMIVSMFVAIKDGIIPTVKKKDLH